MECSFSFFNSVTDIFYGLLLVRTNIFNTFKIINITDNRLQFILIKKILANPLQFMCSLNNADKLLYFTSFGIQFSSESFCIISQCFRANVLFFFIVYVFSIYES